MIPDFTLGPMFDFPIPHIPPGAEPVPEISFGWNGTLSCVVLNVGEAEQTCAL